MDRRALKTEYRTDLVFDVALVGEVEELAGVAEDHEAGRLDAGMRMQL